MKIKKVFAIVITLILIATMVFAYIIQFHTQITSEFTTTSIFSFSDDGGVTFELAENLDKNYIFVYIYTRLRIAEVVRRESGHTSKNASEDLFLMM